MAALRLKVDDIELQMQAPDFWQDHGRAGQLSKELTALKEELNFWESSEQRLADYQKLDDEELASIEDELRVFKKDFDKRYITTFLSGTYDRGNALLSIYSGAGGVDAQDWASMLLGMYRKYADNTGFECTLLHQTYGEQDGTKNATLEIKGRYAYGTLKGEAGVHRLVRISPFSAKSLRHTSFAMVDVLPIVENARVEINPGDLRVDTYKSSGPGGQNVNKLETAVRITHVPTNISVAVQSERSQAQNKEKAMQLLQSRLVKLMEEQKTKELSDIRAGVENSDIEWSSQIRSYVLNPYKLVKDNRTGIESTQPEKVLEGGIDEFIEAEITKLGQNH